MPGLNLWIFFWGGDAESLNYKFSLQEKRVRGWGGGVTVKKKTSSKTCHAGSVKINQLTNSKYVIHV